MRNLILSTLCSGLIAASLPACAAFVPGKVGQENRYQLSYEGEGISRVQSLFSGHAEKGDRLQVTLQAQMETVQVTPTLFSVRLLGVTHRLRINEREQALSGEAEALARPCYLVIDAQGRVRSISFAADVPVTARGTLRTLISGLELVQPRGGGHTWKVEQDTVNGLAQTDYRFRSGNTVEKRILAYPVRRRIGAKGVPQMRPSTQGALHFRFQADHLQRMEGTLVTQFSLASKSFSEARERFQLVRLGGRLEAQSALKPLQSRYQAQCRLEAPTPLHMNDKSLASAKAAWTQVLKGATTTSLLAELAVDDTKNVHDDSGLLDKLCALLTLHPETCADFEQALAAAQPDQFSTRMIVAALASVAGVAQEESPSASQARPFAERALINV
ncbi:MAG: hypothetical protein JWN14_3361, partial [Chthonomonadales bacterium]|nr:hypothetical protein [Chthonomonadales bacterium]